MTTAFNPTTVSKAPAVTRDVAGADVSPVGPPKIGMCSTIGRKGGSLIVTISTPSGPVQTVAMPSVMQEDAGLGVGSSALADDVAKQHRRMVTAMATYRMSGWILARVSGNVFGVSKTKRDPRVTTTASAPRTAARFATEKRQEGLSPLLTSVIPAVPPAQESAASVQESAAPVQESGAALGRTSYVPPFLYKEADAPHASTGFVTEKEGEHSCFVISSGAASIRERHSEHSKTRPTAGASGRGRMTVINSASPSMMLPVPSTTIRMFVPAIRPFYKQRRHSSIGWGKG